MGHIKIPAFEAPLQCRTCGAVDGEQCVDINNVPIPRWHDGRTILAEVRRGQARALVQLLEDITVAFEAAAGAFDG